MLRPAGFLEASVVDPHPDADQDSTYHPDVDPDADPDPQHCLKLKFYN
jgi:hypothetical protein